MNARRVVEEEIARLDAAIELCETRAEEAARYVKEKRGEGLPLRTLARCVQELAGNVAAQAEAQRILELLRKAGVE